MLHNKIALVTGASRGIGKAIAIDLAKNGADVIVNYSRDEKGASEAVEEIRKLGRKSISVRADVGDFNEAARMIEIVRKEFGKLNILVNNAGITKDRSFKNMSEEEWKKVVDINLTGVYNVTKNALPLLERNSRIINISSIVGLYGNFGQANYAASKAGIHGFTKTLSKELAKNGITANAIAPGFIESEMTEKIPFIRKKIIEYMIPLKRTGKPEEIAYLASFLASDKSSYMTGQVISINGGLAF